MNENNESKKIFCEHGKDVTKDIARCETCLLAKQLNVYRGMFEETVQEKNKLLREINVYRTLMFTVGIESQGEDSTTDKAFALSTEETATNVELADLNTYSEFSLLPSFATIEKLDPDLIYAGLRIAEMYYNKFAETAAKTKSKVEVKKYNEKKSRDKSDEIKATIEANKEKKIETAKKLSPFWRAVKTYTAAPLNMAESDAITLLEKMGMKRD